MILPSRGNIGCRSVPNYHPLPARESTFHRPESEVVAVVEEVKLAGLMYLQLVSRVRLDRIFVLVLQVSMVPGESKPMKLVKNA